MVQTTRTGFRINHRIRAEEVRLIDHNNVQVGLVKKREALAMAAEAELDLVEVAPNSQPPVCRIMDYGKWLYQQKRKQREASKKSHKSAGSLKEIRLRPETDKHDLEIKVKHGREFLEKGHKVQFSVFFRGRQMLHTDHGRKVLDDIIVSLEDIAKVERPTRMTGKRMILLLVPRG